MAKRLVDDTDKTGPGDDPITTGKSQRLSGATHDPALFDLSTIEGILALIALSFDVVLGKGLLVQYITLRAIYAPRVAGADLFHLAVSVVP